MLATSIGVTLRKVLLIHSLEIVKVGKFDVIRFQGRKTALVVASILIVGGVASWISEAASSSDSGINPNPNYIPNKAVTVSTLPNPWTKFRTAVNPGSSMSFITSEIGWKIDGIGPQPYQFGGIGAGANLTNFIKWPGTSVSSTSDGGSLWKSILDVPDGVWGIDLLSPSVGFVVGVTSLYMTVDGGQSWSTVQEPQGMSLVSVDFTSPQDGFGLSTGGQLFETGNSGETWQSIQTNEPSTSLCVSTSNEIFVSDSEGDILGSTDGGSTWTSLFNQANDLSGAAQGWIWTSLSCNSLGDAAAGIFSTQNSEGSNYEIATGNGAQGSWKSIQPAEAGSDSSATSNNSWPTTFGSIALDGDGGVLLVGDDGSTSNVDIVHLNSDGTTVSSSQIATGLSVPSDSAAVGLGPSGTFINGASVVNSNYWIMTTNVNSNLTYTSQVFGYLPAVGAWQLMTNTGQQPQVSQVSPSAQIP